MKTNRRGLLKLVLSGAAALLVQANGISGTLKNTNSSSKSSTGPAKVLLASSSTKDTSTNRVSATPKEVLCESYFPVLKLNEGEREYFYLCSAKKVTVGYGTNTEDNPKALTNVNIYRNKKLLTDTERAAFFKKMEQNPGKEWRKLQEEIQKLKEEEKQLTQKGKGSTLKLQEIRKRLETNKQKLNICDAKVEKYKAELKQFTIQLCDAEKMARTDMSKTFNCLERTCVDPDTKKSYFSDLPICMQIMTLDIYYNIGGPKFDNYQKYQAALRRGDFATATKESTVYTNPVKKEVNINRELRKQRSLAVMNIVQNNYKKNISEILKLIAQDHNQAKLNEKPGDRKVNLEAEASLAFGEYLNCHRILAQTCPEEACPIPTKELLPGYIKECQKMILIYANQKNNSLQRNQQNQSR